MGLYEANLSVALAPGQNVRRGDIVDIDDEALAARLMRRGWIRPHREPYQHTHPVIPPDELPEYGGGEQAEPFDASSVEVDEVKGDGEDTAELVIGPSLGDDDEDDDAGDD